MFRDLLILFAFLLCGCTTTVRPPAGVVDPVTVYIADYGRHASLVLPVTGESAGDVPRGYVEFAFGQFDWYALNKDDWFRVPFVMLVPSQGTIGRRGMDAERLAAFSAELEFLIAIKVERERADALLARLEARWREHAGEAVYNPVVDLTFSRDPASYSIFRNCNSVVAGWLRDLGCETSGVTVAAELEVTRPSEPSRAR